MTRLAQLGDLPAVTALLDEADLCYDDLTPEHMLHFLVLRKGDELVGAVGLEAFDSDALLRSLIVAPGHRGEGLGIRLVDGIEEHARERGVASLYLLTTTADRFFERHGYERIERASVPGTIGETTEFLSFCPDSAVCMLKELG